MRLVLVAALLLLLLAGIAIGTYIGVRAATHEGAKVSATNGRIVFSQGFPNYGFTINSDGSDRHKIGPSGSTTCTTWSPDSSKLLCSRWRKEGVEPATANPDGSGFTLLNPNLPLDLFCLNWSPTGARLLCHSEGKANPIDAGLYTVRSSDASDLVRVSPASSDNGYGYSPDGARILYAHFAKEHGTLFSVKPDGSDPVQLSPPRLSIIDLGFFDRVGADWAPDGSRVAFAAQKLSSTRFTTALFVVNADGTGLRQITPSGRGARSAQWSPNGALIAFTSCCGLPQAWVVHPNGTGLRQVTTAVGGAATPVWSPDSTKLLINRQDRNNQASLWTVNTDGSGLSKLADTQSLSLFAWGSAPAD